MSELTGLYEIIEEDPRAFLKFIRNACRIHLFEESICCTCPMYKLIEKGKGGCKFMKRIPVRPDYWDCHDEPTPKERIRPGTPYIHISDVERVFSDMKTTIDEKDRIVPEIEIPYHIKSYVNAYEFVLTHIKQLESDHRYEFITLELIEKLNFEANHWFWKEIMPEAFGPSEWFHVDFRENDYNHSMLLYKVIPKNKECHDTVYKWLTTTKGAEYYAANNEAAKLFIHDYKAGAFDDYKEI
mgnify:CR=1 FL=1